MVSCDDAEAALGSEEPAACPEAALLGTAEVSLAGMPTPLSGKIFLGFTESEEEERLLLIAEGEGLNLKLPIGFSEEPESGRLQLALEQPADPDRQLHARILRRPKLHLQDAGLLRQLPDRSEIHSVEWG